MFLTMLAKLDREGVLNSKSEVKNIGLVIAIFIKLADVWRQCDVLADEEQEERLKSTPGKTFKFNPAEFDAYVHAYAYQNSIPLQGPADIGDLIDEFEDVELATVGDDPWKWATSFKNYKRDFGMSPRAKAKIGGDTYDITAWTSAERKKHSFNKKDPLGKDEIKALKDGMILQMA